MSDPKWMTNKRFCPHCWHKVNNLLGKTVCSKHKPATPVDAISLMDILPIFKENMKLMQSISDDLGR